MGVNPKVEVNQLAVESKKKYQEDIKAGHTDGAEYWAGNASAAFLLSNPKRPAKEASYCLWCRGSGRTTNGKCPRCNGTGYEPKGKDNNFRRNPKQFSKKYADSHSYYEVGIRYTDEPDLAEFLGFTKKTVYGWTHKATGKRGTHTIYTYPNEPVEKLIAHWSGGGGGNWSYQLLNPKELPPIEFTPHCQYCGKQLKSPKDEFRNADTLREFFMTGQCQDCQDKRRMSSLKATTAMGLPIDQSLNNPGGPTQVIVPAGLHLCKYCKKVTQTYNVPRRGYVCKPCMGRRHIKGILHSYESLLGPIPRKGLKKRLEAAKLNKTPRGSSFVVAVKPYGQSTFAYNSMYFPTAEAADMWGKDLMGRWMGAESYEVQQSIQPPNYTIIDGVLSRLESNPGDQIIGYGAVTGKPHLSGRHYGEKTLPKPPGKMRGAGYSRPYTEDENEAWEQKVLAQRHARGEFNPTNILPIIHRGMPDFQENPIIPLLTESVVTGLGLGAGYIGAGALKDKLMSKKHHPKKKTKK